MNLSSAVSFPRKRESRGFAAKGTGSPPPIGVEGMLARGQQGGSPRTVSPRLLSIVADQVAPCYRNAADNASAPSSSVTTPTAARSPFSGRRRTVRVATGTDMIAPASSGSVSPQLIWRPSAR